MIPVSAHRAEATRRSERLKAELRRIRRVLAAEPSVRQLLVFGSVAAGKPHEASDLDLLVVEDTAAPFVDRAIRLAQLVRPRVGVQFLVYTPSEMRAVASRPFIAVEILKKGRTMPLDPQGDASRWLAFADEDLRVAELAQNARIFNQACFHAQQAAEKALKACIAAAGEPVLRTHLIVDLLEELPSSARSAFQDLQEELLALDQLYVPTRYPDAVPGTVPEGLPTERHTDRAMVAARRCFEVARGWIGAQGPTRAE